MGEIFEKIDCDIYPVATVPRFQQQKSFNKNKKVEKKS
jgi:hypothetical protein